VLSKQTSRGVPVLDKSAEGHKRKWCHARLVSVLSLKANIRQHVWHIR